MATLLLWLAFFFNPYQFTVPQHTGATASSGGGAKSLAHSCGNSNGGTGVTSLACTLTVGSGDMIVVGLLMKNGSDTSTLADSLSQTYTKDGHETDTGPVNITVIAHKCNSASGSVTFTATLGGTYSFSAVYVGDVPNASTSTCTDATFAGTQGASGANPLNLGALTTVANGDFIFGCGGQNASSGTLTVGTGFTLPAAWSNANNANVCEYQIQTTGGAITPTFANSNTGVGYETGDMGYK